MGGVNGVGVFDGRAPAMNESSSLMMSHRPADGECVVMGLLCYLPPPEPARDVPTTERHVFPRSFFLPNSLSLPITVFMMNKRHSHYYVRVARFMPRVEIVQKYNTAARRLYLRGQNGKIYPYLVVNDACLSDARREERVLQLLRMLNNLLDKQKETARRFLHLAVPRVVAVSPQMRLVEDNPASISLLHIYKQNDVLDEELRYFVALLLGKALVSA
ncbi:hypothetical protein HPB51_020179 [Rhipicephalus microplus]|uniref:PI3K/PI4K catalytic domain-containing protein n=1 Tax=Rhipicephalus microplus TaxID=6941 RepID=A0A9J6D7S1_RHIMP|nr:hypothetical protein HPB51_020179 [Rhipicephalus microplus]